MLKAKDIMTRDVISIKQDAPIVDALRILAKKDVSGIPVTNDEMNLVGILTEKDVLRLYYLPQLANDKIVYHFMTQPAISFDENESLDDVCYCLLSNMFRRVPITSNGKLAGIISRPDMISHIIQLISQQEPAPL